MHSHAHSKPVAAELNYRCEEMGTLKEKGLNFPSHHSDDDGAPAQEVAKKVIRIVISERKWQGNQQRV